MKNASSLLLLIIITILASCHYSKSDIPITEKGCYKIGIEKVKLSDGQFSFNGNRFPYTFFSGTNQLTLPVGLKFDKAKGELVEYRHERTSYLMSTIDGKAQIAFRQYSGRGFGMAGKVDCE